MLWWGLVGLLLGTVLTGCLKFLVVRMNMLDVPGERSSHSQVTPRGGGLSIVFTSMLGVFLLPAGILTAVIVPSLIIAAVGFWDDYRQASRRLRLAVQFVAALLAVIYVQPESLDLAGVRIGGVLLLILLVVWYVWCTNLYNFMDGINGIAGAQAVSVLICILLLTFFGSSDGGIGGIAGLHGLEATEEFFLLMAGACIGFLVWNFPKAHIFMGDAGSAFLGALFAGLSVYLIAHQPELFWGLMIVMGVFVVDSTATLVNRARLRQRIFDAHRSHAYQNASRILSSHTKVTLLVVLINVVWLLPWAFVAVEQMLPGVIALLLAYFPLLIAAIYLRAGAPEKA